MMDIGKGLISLIYLNLAVVKDAIAKFRLHVMALVMYV